MRQNDALEFLEVWLKNQTGQVNLVVIAGGTCSGKSYLAGAINNYFGEGDVSVVQLDDYFKDLDDPTLPHDPSGYPIFDLPQSYHRRQINVDVAALLGGNPIDCPVYDIASNRRTLTTRLIEARKIIVIDGLFSIDFLSHLKHLAIYVDTADALRCERRIERDATRFGVSESIIREVFYAHLLPLHRKYVEPQRSKADILVEGNNG